MMSMLSSHPDDASLLQYAAGESEVRENARIAGHVVGCTACRETVEFARALAISVRGADTPTLPADGLARILAARADGIRTILPADVDVVPRRLSPRTLGAIAAAVLVVAIGTVQSRRNLPPGANDDGIPVLQASVLGLALTSSNPVDRSLPSDPLELDGSRVHPGHWVFEYEIVAGTGDPGRVLGEIDVTMAVMDGVPAWRIADRSLGHPTDMVETTDVDRQTLRPLRRAAHRGGFSQFDVRQQFVHDSVTGLMSTSTRRIRIGRPLAASRGPYAVGEGAPLVMLQAAQLHIGWASTFRVVGWNAAADDTTYAVRGEVVGDDRITTPLGTVDVWTLDLTAGGTVRRFWLRKRDHVPVLSRNDKARVGMVRAATLVSEGLVRQLSR